MKKVLAIGGVGLIILAVFITFLTPLDVVEEDVESISTETKADVIMPTKVSRPGCEETDSCYIPSKIVTNRGEPVNWINEDSAFHSVTSGTYDAPTELFDSGHLDPYEMFSYTFDKYGIYDYYCTLHPWMEGQVIVE